MSKRIKLLSSFYENINEDERLIQNRHGQLEYFTTTSYIHRYEEQLFTGYDICEFEKLFEQYKTKYLTTVALDNVLELAEERKDFGLSDSDFELFCKYHLATCEKRELLGSSSHLLYICKKL